MLQEQVTNLLINNGFIILDQVKIYNQYHTNAITDQCKVYCHDNPWWIIFTQYGHIKVGFRKRVYELDWSGTSYRGILVDDDVTKEGTYIHAWSISDLERYVALLSKQLSSFGQFVVTGVRSNELVVKFGDILKTRLYHSYTEYNQKFKAYDDKLWLTSNKSEISFKSEKDLVSGMYEEGTAIYQQWLQVVNIMGVKQCNRNGCQSIMCDHYNNVYGYICYHCKEELQGQLKVNGSVSVSQFMASNKLERVDIVTSQEQMDCIFVDGSFEDE